MAGSERSSGWEDPAQRPMWQEMLVQYIVKVRDREVTGDNIRVAGTKLAIYLLECGQLDHVGEWEQYVRDRGLPVYFAAVPIEELPPTPGVVCIDPVTREPRRYYMGLTFGDLTSDPESVRVRELCADQETNIARLTSETGFFLGRMNSNE